MKRIITTKAVIAFLMIACLAFAVACKKDKPRENDLKNFMQVNLVGNNDEYAPLRIDTSLINAWGLAWAPSGIAWVNSEESGIAFVLDGEGGQVRPPVAIPSPGGAAGGMPTGMVNNPGTGFVLSNGQPARFIFVGVDGILSAWNQGAGDTALLVKDNSATSAYTGLTIAISGGALHLYAADFRANKIEVWDQNFENVSMAFTDPGIPQGYAPFNIQVVGDELFVTYAKVSPEGDEETGPGKGFVSIFTTEGEFVQRFASRDVLDAPWGVVEAPDSFFEGTENAGMMSGKGGHDGKPDEPTILIGNFGDGHINAFNRHGRFLGAVRKHGQDIIIDGLWAISFPPATSTIDPNRLYFTAGPDDEENGLFGYLIKK